MSIIAQVANQIDWGEFIKSLSAVLGTMGGILAIVYANITQKIKTKADKAEVKADKAETKAEVQQKQISELNTGQDYLITHLKRALDESQQTTATANNLNQTLTNSLTVQLALIDSLTRKIDELEKKVPKIVRERVTGEFKRRDENGFGNPTTPQPS